MAPIWATLAARNRERALREWPEAWGTAEQIEALPSELRPRMRERWEQVQAAMQTAPLADVPAIRDGFRDALARVNAAGADLVKYGVDMAMSYLERRDAAQRLRDQASAALNDSDWIDGGPRYLNWEHMAEEYGLDPDSEPDKLRAIDRAYWQRRINREARQAIERTWLAAAAEKMDWISPSAKIRREKTEIAQALWAERTEICADDGDDFTPPTTVSMADIMAGKARRQYAELLARAKGISKLAAEAGATEAYLATITAPPAMHPGTTHGGGRRANPAWDGSTPQDVHRWANKKWAQARAAWGRRRVGKYWVIGAQAHWDGTPHYHLVIWARDEKERGKIEEVLRDRFEATAADGEARYERGIVIEKCSGGAEGAVAYASRMIQYIARTVGEGKGSTDRDRAEATATAEWGAIWGLRRFRTSHTKATVWKMLRKPDLETGGGPVGQAQDAARAGDYLKFLRAVEAGKIKPAYCRAVSKYKEPTRRLVGVKSEVDGTVYTPRTTWTMRARTVRTVMTKYQGGDRAAGSGADRGSIEARVTPHTGPPVLAAVAVGGGGGGGSGG